MTPKQAVAASLRAFADLPGIRNVLYQPSVRSAIQGWPGFQRLYGRGWELLHPFDLALGTDTSGYIAASKLLSSPLDSQKIHCYAGSQPSIIRTALGVLPEREGYTFLDLGCGKGRPLLVASEFPFRELIGVELSPSLAEGGRKNAAILRQRFPERVPIRIETGDASAFPPPAGKLVVFLYNPFGEEVIAKVVAGIEQSLAAEPRPIFIVYYNPVFGACLDAAKSLTRYYAARLPYAPDELGYGPDDTDNVIIWQGGSAASAHPGADAGLVTINPGMRVELVPRET